MISAIAAERLRQRQYDGYDLEFLLLDDEDDYEDDGFEITCPSCGETIVFDGNIDPEGELICPHCKEKIVYETEDKE